MAHHRAGLGGHGPGERGDLSLHQQLPDSPASWHWQTGLPLWHCSPRGACHPSRWMDELMRRWIGRWMARLFEWTVPFYWRALEISTHFNYPPPPSYFGPLRKISSWWEVFCVKQCLLLRGESGFHYSYVWLAWSTKKHSSPRAGLGWAIVELSLCVLTSERHTFAHSLRPRGFTVKTGHQTSLSAVGNMCCGPPACQRQMRDCFRTGREAASRVCLCGAEVGGGRPSGGMCFSTLSPSLF